MYPELKENRPHGTDNYPYTQYHMHNIFHAFQIPVHWHDELEVICTKKGPLNLLIDGKNILLRTVRSILLLRGSFI